MYWVAGSVPTTYRTTRPVAAALTRVPDGSRHRTRPLHAAPRHAPDVAGGGVRGGDPDDRADAAAVAATCPAADRTTTCRR
jgi:hypothetical protein